jgi:hypothetical protein
MFEYYMLEVKMLYMSNKETLKTILIEDNTILMLNKIKKFSCTNKYQLPLHLLIVLPKRTFLLHYKRNHECDY